MLNPTSNPVTLEHIRYEPLDADSWCATATITTTITAPAVLWPQLSRPLAPYLNPWLTSRNDSDITSLCWKWISQQLPLSLLYVAQHKRIKVLEDFRAGRLRVLVATDVAGRGIHVDDISHVVNFTLPEDPDDYVHRIGRTGRAGTTGVSISFAGEDDSYALPPIEALLGHKIQCETPTEDLLVAPPKSR